MKKQALLLATLVMLPVFAQAQTYDINGSNIEIQKIKTEPVPLQTSEYADIWFKVVNTGDSTAENVTVKFRPEFPFSTDPGEQVRWVLREVEPSQEYTLHMQVRVDKNAVSGTSYLDFVVSEGDAPSCCESWAREKIPVEIRTDDAVLAVTKVGFPGNVAPGATQTMNLTLKNLADSQLKNIEVSLDLSAKTLPFAVAGTSSKHVQSIESGATEKVSYRLQVDSDASNGVYKLPITLSYENEAGTSFTSSLVTGVVVGGETNLQVGVNERARLMPDTTGKVTLRIVNAGEGQAKFVSVTVPDGENYEVLSTNDIYLGNMGPDDYQTAEVELYVSGRENFELPVTLHYRDGTGQKVVNTQNVSLDVYTAEEVRKYNMQKRGNTWIAGVVLLVLAGGAVYWWRRRR
ncbi:MAG: COG1361 S-layer family protein [Candidatus Nanohaloarchaea archaeon]